MLLRVLFRQSRQPWTLISRKLPQLYIFNTSYFPRLSINCLDNINNRVQVCYNYCTFYNVTETDDMADNKYAVDYDKRGQASCKKCRAKIGKGALRIAKLTTNFFSDDGGEMKQYFHPSCIFETFVKARATTKIIDDIEFLQGYRELKDDDKSEIRKLVAGKYENSNGDLKRGYL